MTGPTTTEPTTLGSAATLSSSAVAAGDVRIAKIHLRLGQLSLARAELEDLLRRDALDLDGLAALAEVRWRTGDGTGATAAAEAHLEAGGSDIVALCIAAEAAAADGRTNDAREFMDRVAPADALTLDAIFAGMPRRAFWPTAPANPTDLEELRRPMAGISARAGAGSTKSAADPDTPARSIPGPREVIDAISSGAWAVGGATRADAGALAAVGATRQDQLPVARRVKGQLDPSAELAQARTELGTRPERALLRLSLVLRHDPTLAPAVLEALHLRREPAAALVRGDAQRLLGRHLEAEAAFDAAAESLEAP